MKAWIARWFPRVWRARHLRFRVAGEYAALAQSEHMLADLCMRNSVFAPVKAQSLWDAGVAEGRRRCVLEILDMARADPRAIAALEVQPEGGGESYAQNLEQ